MPSGILPRGGDNMRATSLHLGYARNKLFRSSKQVVFPGETSYFEKQNKLFSLLKQLILHQGIKRTKARSSKETFPGMSPFVAWNSWMLSGSTAN